MFHQRKHCFMEEKVYFAGSIRGGREDAAVYKRIIDYINTRVRDKKRLEKVGNLVKNSYLYR